MIPVWGSSSKTARRMGASSKTEWIICYNLPCWQKPGADPNKNHGVATTLSETSKESQLTMVSNGKKPRIIPNGPTQLIITSVVLEIWTGWPHSGREEELSIVWTLPSCTRPWWKSQMKQKPADQPNIKQYIIICYERVRYHIQILHQNIQKHHPTHRWYNFLQQEKITRSPLSGKFSD